MALSLQMTAWMRREKLTDPADGVLVAFSGGPDSVCLLLALEEQKRALKLSFLCACHVHHGLRGAAADADEAFCADFCAAHHIPYICRHVEVRKEAERTGASVETAARELRYSALEQAADELEKIWNHPCKIATAHHGDDQAETVLFRLARGTGLSGLCGIPAKRGRIIRPLLFCQRADILSDLAERQQAFCTDATNSDETIRRNFLRHRVVPLLEELNPRFSADLTEHVQAWRADDLLLQQMTQKALTDCEEEKGLNIRAFLSLPEALQNRVAAAFLAQRGIDSSLLRIGHLKSVAKKERQYAQLGGGFSVRRAGNLLILSDEKEEKIPFPAVKLSSFPMRIPAAGAFPELFVRLELQVHKKLIESSKKPLFLSVDYDTIKGSPVLRNPTAEDRIRPLGMDGHKSVTVLLREAGVRPPFYDALVLADDDGVLAVYAENCRRCACRCALTKETRRALVLEFSPGQDTKKQQ